LTHFCSTLLALFLFSSQADFEAQFVSGLTALNEHRLAAAQTSLQAAGHLQPANPLVWVALAQTYWKLRKTAQAAEAAARAEQLGTDDPVTLRSLATYYSEQKKFSKAGDLEARCAAREPTAAPRAMIDYLQAHQPRQAIEIALATPGWEGKADIRNLLGKAYEADGQILKTISELQEAIRLKPGDESYYFDLLQVLLSHYNFEAAIQVGELGRKTFPGSAQLALATGVAYFGQNRSDAAIGAFLEAIDLAPDVEQPYLFLARLLTEAHERLQAILQRAVDDQHRNPGSDIGYFLHARVLMFQSQEPDEAEILLRKAITLDGKYWESHFDLGVLLANRHAWQEAEKEFRRSTELNPKDPASHYRLFRALVALGRTQEAEAELARQRKISELYKADLNRSVSDVKRLEISPAK
jgi:tetratricopeptide (TPR) repeat protein